MEKIGESEYTEAEYLHTVIDIDRLIYRIMTDERLNHSLELLVSRSRELVQAEVTSVLILDKDSGELFCPIVSADDETIGSKLKKLRFPLESSILQRVFRTGKPLKFPAPDSEKGLIDISQGELSFSKSLLCVPLNMHNRTIGILEALNKKLGEFSAADQYILEIMCAYMTLYVEREIAYYYLRRERTLGKTLKVKGTAYRGCPLVGRSDGIMRAIKMAEQVACTDASVLIYGETGTGKELLARMIHEISHRSSGNFVAVNCASIPETLLESELFGHEKGAFTNALTRRIGRFQEANGGTIFLDEIGDMPMNMQVKLLRVLEEGSVRPLGASQDITVDVRFISATNQDLRELIGKDRFRQDLYYRLNTFEIWLPPLRQRKEDIPLLVEHFMNVFNHKLSKAVKNISTQAMELLIRYDYPGNVRELRNIIERAMILTYGDSITVDHLPEVLTRDDKTCLDASPQVPRNDEELKVAKLNAQMDVERAFLIDILSRCHGNISEAARRANMNRSWLSQLIKRHGIDPNQFRLPKRKG